MLRLWQVSAGQLASGQGTYWRKRSLVDTPLATNLRNQLIYSVYSSGRGLLSHAERGRSSARRRRTPRACANPYVGAPITFTQRIIRVMLRRGTIKFYLQRSPRISEKKIRKQNISAHQRRVPRCPGVLCLQWPSPQHQARRAGRVLEAKPDPKRDRERQKGAETCAVPWPLSALETQTRSRSPIASRWHEYARAPEADA
jgi:hypothetical protein